MSENLKKLMGAVVVTFLVLAAALSVNESGGSEVSQVRNLADSSSLKSLERRLVTAISDLEREIDWVGERVELQTIAALGRTECAVSERAGADGISAGDWGEGYWYHAEYARCIGAFVAKYVMYSDPTMMYSPTAGTFWTDDVALRIQDVLGELGYAAYLYVDRCPGSDDCRSFDPIPCSDVTNPTGPKAPNPYAITIVYDYNPSEEYVTNALGETYVVPDQLLYYDSDGLPDGRWGLAFWDPCLTTLAVHSGSWASYIEAHGVVAPS